ncbi:MAG: hypothetical protein IKL03_01510 [Bacteroidaceae bacterium]|nr:hypothetical protein [Bacteroidaceae bacterium]
MRKKTDLVIVIVIVNVASALCQAKNKTFLLTTQWKSVATDTPQLGVSVGKQQQSSLLHPTTDTLTQKGQT